MGGGWVCVVMGLLPSSRLCSGGGNIRLLSWFRAVTKAAVGKGGLGSGEEGVPAMFEQLRRGQECSAAGEGTKFRTQAISPPSFWCGTGRPDVSEDPESPPVSQTGLTWGVTPSLLSQRRPKETESRQLKLLGGHKREGGGGRGGSDRLFSVRQPYCYNNTISTLFHVCMMYQYKTFP